MIKDITDLALEIGDKTTLALLIIPSLVLNVENFADKALESLKSARSWKIRILISEAKLLLKQLEDFTRNLNESLEQFRRDPERNYKELSLYIPYMMAKEDERGEKFFNKLIDILKDLFSNDRIELDDVNEFFNVFMRYFLMFDLDATSILEKLYDFYSEIDASIYFLDTLANYLKYGYFVPIPTSVIKYLYENIYRHLDYSDYQFVRFLGTLLLNLSRIDNDKALAEYRKLKDVFSSPVDSFKLYTTIRDLSARVGLTFSLLKENLINHYFEETKSLIYDLKEFAKQLKWKYDDWRRGNVISLEDIDIFAEEFKEIAEEEYVGEIELLEDPNYYFNTVISYLANTIEAILTDLVNILISGKNEKVQQAYSIARNLLELLELFPYFDSSFKASVYASMAVITSKVKMDDSLEALKKTEKYVITFCTKEEEFYCNELILEFGDRIAKMYFLTKDNNVLEYLIDLLTEKESHFKKNRFLLRGFASGLYGMATLLDYWKKYKEALGY